MIRYEKPGKSGRWLLYEPMAIMPELVAAKAAVLALREMPSQKSWAEHLQVVQLKREIAGTSRIEGADFTERELDAAMRETPDQLQTRSQKQAAAAVMTYRWISRLPDDRPMDRDLICEIHRRIVTDADDDHCPPGRIRGQDQNVHFGLPRHRGAEGGAECEASFTGLMEAVRGEFPRHDPLVQALALHYHFAAMHPFLDGNGRTARAIEALMLQRTGLRDTLFVAMSNYYYEEKTQYLSKLAEVRSNGHELTAFIRFGLRGIELQCKRLLHEIRINVRKALYRNLMFDLFHRLKTPRRRVMADRQVEILKVLLDTEELTLDELAKRTKSFYNKLSSPYKALIRDINDLIGLKSINFRALEGGGYLIFIRLEWPTEITETEFFNQIKKMPKAKTHSFLG